MTTNIYLNFDGNCEQAFNFYKEALGGEFTMFQRFSDMPADPNQPPLDEKYHSQIMHISLSFGGDCAIMGSDQPPGFGPPRQVGNNFSISISADSRDHADIVLASLSEGGMVTMPMADIFWGSYFGMCQDKFGVNWMVGYDVPQEA